MILPTKTFFIKAVALLLFLLFLFSPFSSVFAINSINSTIFNHADQLGSSSIETNAAGQIVESLDYYPFGSVRLDEKTSSYEDNHKYTSKELDEETNLYYYGARYYNGKIGRFVSEDPAYLAVGDNKRLEEETGLRLDKYLQNSQNLNSYSYTINNPLKYVDEKGKWFDIVVDAGFIGYDLYKLGQSIFTGGDTKGEAASLGLDVGSAAIPGVVGLGAVARVARVADKAGDAEKLTKGVGASASKLLGTRRDNLLQGVENPKLINYIKDLFKQHKSGNIIGDGGAIDAFKYTAKTGELVGGTDHAIKIKEISNGLNKLLKNSLSNNDRQKAEWLADSIKDALKGGAIK
jgi:RHS repeat-associated protein